VKTSALVSASELNNDVPKATGPSAEGSDVPEAPAITLPSESREQTATLGERTFNCCYPGRVEPGAQSPSSATQGKVNSLGVPWMDPCMISDGHTCERLHHCTQSSLGLCKSCSIQSSACDSPECLSHSGFWFEVAGAHLLTMSPL
jgi:hypothetical protein